ncbi:hypothetical protein [Spirosoma validum]|uniref:Uncharacterized protein n=1 Tax=Spirosoma validum TaxID=2771355 RepID=A0A927B4E6_9BACT|nr:hypothetical protein [Spirosoma validum]MBD2755450.1 hypothetical protein [Spirosoma validum]
MEAYQLTAAEAAQLGSVTSSSISFGPLTITWNLDLSVPQIAVGASLLGVSIGQAVLNPSNPSVTLGGSVGIAKATVTLTANFSQEELDYSVDVESFGHTIVNKSGRLFSW